MQMLLGRRIERLFYFGAVLIALCLVQVYIVTTVSYLKSRNPFGLTVLASEMESKLDHLQTLFEHPPISKTQAVEKERDEAVERTRKKLGLPAHIGSLNSDSSETYQSALNGIVESVSIQTGMDASVLSENLDADKAPSALIENVRVAQKKLALAPVVVWGIETPIVIPLQYGKAEYEIPASVIAYFLLLALAPLLVVWLGSLYVTRQRELFAIRELDDYKQAFPHILNILPVEFATFPWVSERRLVNGRRGATRQRAAKTLCGVIRTMVLLMFCAPLLWMFFYSEIEMFNLKPETGFVQFMAFTAISIWLVLQAFMLVLQEWLVLWGKSFVI